MKRSCKSFFAQKADYVRDTYDTLKGKQDVMFYFTGLAHVAKIGSNQFMDGAIADHLTSTGGVLFGKNQMSILRWLDAGATGSYGAVVEPCNFPQKFPHPWLFYELSERLRYFQHFQVEQKCL